MPALFALSLEVIGNRQVATYAAFGAFATLVLAGFGGSTRDKLIAHGQLAVVGSGLVIVGTAVGSSTALAAAVALPVTFAVFFAGMAGPNAASAVTAALLAFVLPASSPGTIGMVPDRVAGWLLASVAGTLAVLLLPTPQGGSGLRAAISKLAATLADDVEVLARRRGADQQEPSAAIEAKRELLAEFHSTPYSPTGLAPADQATANAIELLEWCTSSSVDAAREHSDLGEAPPETRELLCCTAAVLRDGAAAFAGSHRRPDLEGLERLREAEMARIDHLAPEGTDFSRQARLSFHAEALASSALAFGAYTAVGVGMADIEWLAAARRRWFGTPTGGGADLRIVSGPSKYIRVAFRHARLRSTWFINSARGALALSAAVAVADLSSVQHGFWVVLASLSVLRTNASSTGSTALSALLGTVVGFVVGAAFLLAIGTDSTALWVALPIAVLVAGYAPGTLPVAVGQAAFTVTVAVLFNLLVPEGWHVGLVRVEDVAIGAGVSMLVGALFWPRGMASVTGDDLAGAYRAGAAYLLHAVGWVCGLRADRPDEGLAAVAAGNRLDAALRAFIAERGTKRLPAPDLWRLVGGALRLRLTANTISRLPRAADDPGPAREIVGRNANVLAGFYDQLSAYLGKPRGHPVAALAPPVFPEPDGARSAQSESSIWLSEYLEHLRDHLSEVVPAAMKLAEVRRQPWWR